MTSPRVPTAPHDLRARIVPILARMESGLIERDHAVRLALLAALAGEHVLLIGPPGTAKSELARRLQHAFADARYFERLLTRFSVPEELFGPLSLIALEHDRYERLTDGYLPTASVAFLDEVFKANSAILNALLTLLNEREFDNGTGRVRTPLLCVVGATNEVPAEDALLAFYDRFLLRVPVAAVADASFDALLDLDDGDASAWPDALPRAAIDALRTASVDVRLGAAARAALHALRAWTAAARITVSDRRWRQLLQLLRVQAASAGRAGVEPVDLWLVPYAVADKPEHVDALAAWWLDAALASPPAQTPWLERAVEAFEKQLEIETTMQQDDDGEAGKIALARSIGMVTADEGGMPRLVSDVLADKLRKRYSPVHVEARVAQLDEVLAPLDARWRDEQQRWQGLEPTLAAHPWLPPSVRAAAMHRWRSALASMQHLHARLHAVRTDFARLPIDEALARSEPPARIVIEAAA